jgi:hypothetical protein
MKIKQLNSVPKKTNKRNAEQSEDKEFPNSFIHFI